MPSRQLPIIRVGLIAGVFGFAGVALYMRMQGTAPDGISGALPLNALRYLAWTFVAASALATLVLRMRIENATPKQRGAFTVVGWAFGEGVALFGVVLHFIGGPVSSLALGLLAFVFALMMLPVPREQP